MPKAELPTLEKASVSNWGRGFISPDSRHLVYSVYDNGRAFVVVDNHESPLLFDKVAVPTFSPDGQLMVYAGKRNGQWYMVENETVTEKTISGISEIQTIFFRPGTQEYYVVSKNDNTLSIMVNGTTPLPGFEPKEYGYMTNLVQSDDGQHLAFLLEGNTDYIYQDGVMAKLADYVHEGGGLTFSPDSSHFAYAVHDGRKAYCVINGKKQPPYERIKINSLTFNPVTNELFYVAQKDGMRRVVSSSSQGPQFNDFPDQKIAFSPNGKHIAYFAQRYEARSRKNLLVIDHHAEPVTLAPLSVHDTLFTDLIFDSDSQLHFLRQQHYDIYLVEKKLSSS